MPGSVPAGILMLVEVALAIAANVMQPGSSPPMLMDLVVGLGLLFGGPGFRSWGAFRSLVGLVVAPFLFLGGAWGGPTPTNFIGLGYNVGLLLLLGGKPSKTQVRWGVAVCILTFVLMIVAEFIQLVVRQQAGAGG